MATIPADEFMRVPTGLRRVPEDPDRLPELGPNQSLDIERLRHPEENKYLTLIWACNGLVFLLLAGVLIRLPALIIPFLAVVGVLYGLNRLIWQLTYWYLYGNSVLISPSQYPEIYTAVKNACEYIDLKPIPKIFVLHGAGLLELFLMKRFTTRGILVFTSELVDKTLSSGDSRVLMMIIGRQLGHLKAGHYRHWFFKDVVGMLTGVIRAAWWRKCHYTADRVGFLVAGDLDASRRALLTLTVGENLAKVTSIDAIREQDDELRGSFLAWLQHIFSDYPFMIHRIIELESFRNFVRQRAPSAHAEKEVGIVPPREVQFVIHTINVHGSAAIGSENILNAVPHATGI